MPQSRFIQWQSAMLCNQPGASGGNGFYYNICTGNLTQPFSPVEPGMGANNTFTNICYTGTNIASMPPSTCKS